MAATGARQGTGSRVVHLIDSGGFFGAEQVVVTLASEQRRRGADVVIATIVAPQDDGNALGDVARERGLAVHEFVMADGFNRAGLRAIVEWVDRHGVQIVHCHGYKANILMGLGAPAGRRWALVATLHGWTSTRRLSKMWLYEVLAKFALRRFDAVCLVSETLRARLPRKLRRDPRFIAVANGIDTEIETVPLPDDIREFADGRRVIAAVGRLSTEKDFATLVDAMALVAGRGCDCCLVVVGEGHERDALSARIHSLGLESVIFLAGYRQSPRQWLAHCALLALSSRTEGLPMIVLEALVAGVPVVATAVGALPRLLGGSNARVVPVGDSRSLGTAIIATLETPDCEAAREARRAIVREDYSAEAMASHYETVYARAAEEIAA